MAISIATAKGKGVFLFLEKESFTWVIVSGVSWLLLKQMIQITS